MEDFDFDKRFADKMRHAGAPDFSDEDWERLAPHLDAAHQRRWRALPLWWLGVLSGLLLCSNIAWWWMWRQSEQRAEAFRSEWVQKQQTTPTQHDTVYQKVIIHQYDTVYRTIVYRTAPPGNALNSERTTGAPETGGAAVPGQKAISTTNTMPEPDAAQQVSTTKNGIPAIDTTGQRSGEGKKAGATGHAFEQQKIIASLELLPLRNSLLPIEAKRLHIPEKDPVAAPGKRAHRPLVLVPRTFRGGAGAGLLIPVANNLSGSAGFTTCLTGEIVFSDHLALTLEGAYSGITFSGTTYDEQLGLPPEKSPGDDYILKYFEVEEGVKPILQLTAGMRYWIRPTHKLSPYLGFGYGMQWHPGYELKAEYYNPLMDKEKEVSREVSALAMPISLLDLNAGLRYRFLRHFFWQTGLSYQFKPDAGQPGIPHFWGLKSSVLYGF